MMAGEYANVVRALVVGTQDHPCLTVSCTEPDCEIARLVKSVEGVAFDWKELLKFPADEDATRAILRETDFHTRARKYTKEELNSITELQSKYVALQRTLVQQQNRFRAVQKIQFAALLKEQMDARAELTRSLTQLDRCERELLNKCETYLVSNDLERRTRLDVLRERIDLKKKSAKKEETMSRIVSEGSSKMEEFLSAMDDPSFESNIAEDMHLLENEALEVSKETTPTSESGNIAVVKDPHVNGSHHRVLIKYVRSQTTEIVDSSELTLAEKDSTREARRMVIQKITQHSKVTTELVTELPSLLSDGDTEKRGCTYMVLKSDGMLSTLLRFHPGSGVPETVPIDFHVLQDLHLKSVISKKNFEELKEVFRPGGIGVAEDELRKGVTVIVRRAVHSHAPSSSRKVGEQLSLIRDEMYDMQQSMASIETRHADEEGEDSSNRWCWQRWWTPTASLAQESRIASSSSRSEGGGDDDDTHAHASRLFCFCWGGNHHGQLGESQRLSDPTNGQDMNMANVRKVKPYLDTLDRPLALVVRQIVCSRFQTVLLLHEGIVMTTIKRDGNKRGRRSSNMNGSFTQIKFPKGTMPVQFLAAGDEHFLALTDDSKKNLYAWGRNDSGQLGLGHTSDSKTPRAVYLPDTSVQERVTFAACGSDFSFCVTATNRVFSWGSNKKGKLAQWILHRSDTQNDNASSAAAATTMFVAPQCCQAWETYRESNLPYHENIALNDTHCPIKDGWKTYHRLMISCGHDHAFSWQTTQEQLKHAHGFVESDASDAMGHHRYEPLCPRSQHYARDMERVIGNLREVLAKIELIKVRYKRLKSRAARWRQSAIHNEDRANANDAARGMSNAIAEHSLEHSDNFLHMKESLADVRGKRRNLRKRLDLLRQKRAKLIKSIRSCTNEVDLQSRNVNLLSSRIESEKHRIREIQQRVQMLTLKINDVATTGTKNAAKLEDEIRRLESERETLTRDHEVNVELHKFGKVNMSTRKLASLQTKLEGVERDIEADHEKYQMYSREAKSLKDSVTSTVKEAKRVAYAQVTTRHVSAGSMKKKLKSGRGADGLESSSGTSRLEVLVETAQRLKVQLDRSSVKNICKEGSVTQTTTSEDPSQIARNMLERAEHEIRRQFQLNDADLMGNVTKLIRDVLLQNCSLQRQANGLRASTEEFKQSGTKQRESKASIGAFESDSGSDEFLSE